MARLDKTIQNYKDKLRNKGIDNIPEFVQSILDADITKGKYSRFLLDCYIDDKFREEDLEGGLDSTIGQAITLFHKHKSKLPENMRSLYKYDSPGSLWNAVKQFDGELSGKELKKDEKEKVYAETEFLYENSETGLKIISPLTKESAKWWGKGTRWCTAAEKNNMFYRYAKDAPLLILLMPGGEKLQLWKNGDNIQFMDEADNNISLDYTEKNWDILEPVIDFFRLYPFLPTNKITSERLLSYYEYKEKIPLIILEEDLLTPEIYELSANYADNFKHIPDEYKTENTVKNYLQAPNSFFSRIPEEYQTEEMAELYLKNKGDIRDIPENILTYNICKIAVEQNGLALKNIPDNYKTREIVFSALKNNVQVFENISSLKIDYDGIKKDMIEANGEVIKYLIVEDEELIKKAVKSNPKAIIHLTKRQTTEEICRIVLEQDAKMLPHIPTEYLTEKDYVKYLNSYHYESLFNPFFCDFLPEKLCTEEFFSQINIMYDLIPEHFKEIIWNNMNASEKYSEIFDNFKKLNDNQKSNLNHLIFNYVRG